MTWSNRWLAGLALLLAAGPLAGQATPPTAAKPPAGFRIAGLGGVGIVSGGNRELAGRAMLEAPLAGRLASQAGRGGLGRDRRLCGRARALGALRPAIRLVGRGRPGHRAGIREGGRDAGPPGRAGSGSEHPRRWQGWPWESTCRPGLPSASASKPTTGGSSAPSAPTGWASGPGFGSRSSAARRERRSRRHARRSPGRGSGHVRGARLAHRGRPLPRKAGPAHGRERRAASRARRRADRTG